MNTLRSELSPKNGTSHHGRSCGDWRQALDTLKIRIAITSVGTVQLDEHLEMLRSHYSTFKCSKLSNTDGTSISIIYVQGL